MPEEHKPWAIIMVRALAHPVVELDIIPLIRIPIWPTEEYAISDFMSLWRTHTRPVIEAPSRAIEA